MENPGAAERRVRGILLTRSDGVLLIKRIRPGLEPYWVFPGGGVEQTDPTLEDALAREIREELGGDPVVLKLVHVLERRKGAGVERESYFVGEIHAWNPSLRSGPEFLRSDSGQYIYDEVPLRPDVLATLNIKPDEMKEWLVEHAATLMDQPDLR